MRKRDQPVASGIILITDFAGTGLYFRKEVVRSMIGIVRRDALRVLDSSPR